MKNLFLFVTGILLLSGCEQLSEGVWLSRAATYCANQWDDYVYENNMTEFGTKMNILIW